MIEMCGCRPNTAGRHASDCPLYKGPLVSVMSFQILPKGWECPKCGAVWAPGVRHCTYCTPIGVTVVTTG